MILALVLLVLLAVSMLYNIGNFASAIMRGSGTVYRSREFGPRIEEFVREDNGAAQKIAVIEVQGIITGQSLDGSGFGIVDVLKAQLKRAEEDHKVKAVILKVDSPGGEVLASDDIYQAIKSFQDKTGKPVIASMGSLAASGGYYISSPCRWIVANDLTITGSIGVIMSSFNYRGLMDKVGLVPQTYKSGRFKDMLSGSRKPEDITADERKMVQDLIDQTFERFKNVVKEGRKSANEINKEYKEKGRELSGKWEEYADGRVLSGRQAWELGFVDQLGGFDDAVARARQLANLAQADLVEYQQRHDLADLFRLFGSAESRAIKVDIGMEAPKLQAGKLYFLSPVWPN